MLEDFATPAAPFSSLGGSGHSAASASLLGQWTESPELCRVHLCPCTSFSLLATEHCIMDLCFWVSWMPGSCSRQEGWGCVVSQCSVLRISVTPPLPWPPPLFPGAAARGHESHMDLRNVCQTDTEVAAGSWEQLGSVCSWLQGQAVNSRSRAPQWSIVTVGVCPCHQQEKLPVPSRGFFCSVTPRSAWP